MRWTLVTALAVAWSIPAGAGEVVLKNGTRLRADLVSPTLVVSTGTDLIEIGSGEVAELTPEGVTLADGRTVRGTLVGGHLRTRTELGQLTVPLDDLQVFRAAEPSATPPAPASPPPAPSPVAVSPAPRPHGPDQVADGARAIGQGFEQTARGIGRTVADGAGRVHDGVKAFGLAIRDGVRGIGRAVERAFGE